jgi:hypothetical protein
MENLVQGVRKQRTENIISYTLQQVLTVCSNQWGWDSRACSTHGSDFDRKTLREHTTRKDYGNRVGVCGLDASVWGGLLCTQ